MTERIWRSSACWFIIIPAIISAPSIVMRFHPLCSLLPWYHAFNYLSTSAWYLLVIYQTRFSYPFLVWQQWYHMKSLLSNRRVVFLAVWRDGLISCGMNRFQSCHLHAMIAHDYNHCKSGVSPCFPMFLTGCVCAHVIMRTITIIPHKIALCNIIMLFSHYFHNFACGSRLAHAFTHGVCASDSANDSETIMNIMLFEY